MITQSLVFTLAGPLCLMDRESARAASIETSRTRVPCLRHSRTCFHFDAFALCPRHGHQTHTFAFVRKEDTPTHPSFHKHAHSTHRCTYMCTHAHPHPPTRTHKHTPTYTRTQTPPCSSAARLAVLIVHLDCAKLWPTQEYAVDRGVGSGLGVFSN